MRYLLHDVFTDTVQKQPDSTAIYQEDGTTITYAQLNEQSNRFASYFAARKPDIRTRPYVGILSPVHMQSIAACLGILKIGGAYIPLDEYSPDERLAAIVQNTGLEVIVIDAPQYEAHKALLYEAGVEHVVILGDSTPEPSEKFTNLTELAKLPADEPPELNQVCDDLAYILHSSGSTGVPKGIMLSHRNARTFVDWMQKEFKLTPKDMVMSRAPFKFDLSVFDIFNTFNAGATLVCYDWNKKREGDAKHVDYVQLMERTKATVLYTTPSTFIALTNRGGLAEADLHLREIMYAGEPFPTPLLRKLQTALPNTRIANIYGPTETNIITYYWIDELPADDTAVPLGYVVEDTEIIVVNEAGDKLCEPDEMGELWCRGGTVTLGYLGLEEKTKACLVRSPFHSYPAYFWRTGDYGFRDAKGLLHYKGRKDHMVKVKGFRIELGEIESALAKMPELDEFVVVAVPDEKYGNRLYCYYAPLAGQQVNDQGVQDFLAKKVPEYMIPYRFVQQPTLPKTSSGKIDRVQLAQEAAEMGQPTVSDVIVGPVTPFIDGPIIYALDSEESSMLGPESDLSPSDIEEDDAYIRENSLYTLSILLTSRPEDYYILDTIYESQAYLIDWLRKLYAPLGVGMSEHVLFAEPKHYAETAKQVLESESGVRAITTICYSYNLAQTFPDSTHLEASRYVNAKTALPLLGQKYNLSVPHTIITTVAQVVEKCKTDFDLDHSSVFAKLDGLGGGFGVFHIQNLDEAEALQQNYPHELRCILQQAVDDSYVETSHLYTIDEAAAKYECSRVKLTANHARYGNIFIPNWQLAPAQQHALDMAAQAVQKEGYRAAKPLLLGMDAFMNGDELLLTEYNARWSGSSAPEFILRRLGLRQKVMSIGVIDTIREDELKTCMQWLEAHMYNPETAENAPFSVLPLGFSGYVEEGTRLISYIVIGDFHAFKQAARETLNEASLPLLDRTAELFDTIMNKLSAYAKEKQE
ncbi:MAG TPA: amino acid adenylation domain-containing protein [Candidatus Saccharimonadales bacterium]|nr:amino acid adenylation domain-containing protein [Candidatus Saccharimonadales bacterium]